MSQEGGAFFTGLILGVIFSWCVWCWAFHPDRWTVKDVVIYTTKRLKEDDKKAAELQAKRDDLDKALEKGQKKP